MIFKRVKYRPFVPNARGRTEQQPLKDIRSNPPEGCGHHHTWGRGLCGCGDVTDLQMGPLPGVSGWTLPCKYQRSYKDGRPQAIWGQIKRSQSWDPRARIGAVWPHTQKVPAAVRSSEKAGEQTPTLSGHSPAHLDSAQISGLQK